MFIIKVTSTLQQYIVDNILSKVYCQIIASFKADRSILTNNVELLICMMLQDFFKSNSVRSNFVISGQGSNLKIMAQKYTIFF